MAQTGDALVDIELSGSGSDGITPSVATEVEVQDVDAINVGGISETEIETTKKHGKVLATPAVR